MSLSATYSFNIIVKGLPLANSTSNSSQPYSSANSTTIPTPLSTLNLLPIVKKKPVNKNLKSKLIELTASLSVNKEGIATITFNKEVYAIPNITSID